MKTSSNHQKTKKHPSYFKMRESVRLGCDGTSWFAGPGTSSALPPAGVGRGCLSPIVWYSAAWLVVVVQGKPQNTKCNRARNKIGKKLEGTRRLGFFQRSVAPSPQHVCRLHRNGAHGGLLGSAHLFDLLSTPSGCITAGCLQMASVYSAWKISSHRISSRRKSPEELHHHCCSSRGQWRSSGEHDSRIQESERQWGSGCWVWLGLQQRWCSGHHSWLYRWPDHKWHRLRERVDFRGTPSVGRFLETPIEVKANIVQILFLLPTLPSNVPSLRKVRLKWSPLHLEICCKVDNCTIGTKLADVMWPAGKVKVPRNQFDID